MSTKNNPGVYDCYANAEPDEPMFVLLGRDKHAPCLVWLWAALRQLDEEDPAKVQEARECCAQMMEWAYNHNRPVVGFGQATLAGTIELIKTINGFIKQMSQETKNQATDIEVMRRFLAETRFKE